MRLLADENVPEPLVVSLELAGHDVLRVRCHRHGIPDKAVLDVAHREQRLLLTRDLDFGDLVLRQKRPSCGAILLRFDRGELEETSESLIRVLAEHGERLHRSFVVLRPERIRLKALGVQV